LQDAVDAFADEALGGTKTARTLAQHVARAAAQARRGATTKKPARALRRIAKELRRFDALLARAEQRGTVASDVAAVLRAASTEVVAAVGRLEALG
jgi:hypothetical protein